MKLLGTPETFTVSAIMEFKITTSSNWAPKVYSLEEFRGTAHGQ